MLLLAWAFSNKSASDVALVDKVQLGDAMSVWLANTGR